MLENISIEKTNDSPLTYLYRPVFNSVMVDIETLGVCAGCAILSVAAVFFNDKTGATGPAFKQNIDMQSCFSLNLRAEKETMKWWEQQDIEVYRSLTIDAKPITEVLSNLAWFIKQYSGDKIEFWSNGGFDFNIRQYAFIKTGIVIPWEYNAVRDVRTIVSLNKQIKEHHPIPEKRHDPLVDCIYQIGYLCETLKTIHIVNQAGKPTDRITIESNLYQIPTKEKDGKAK